MSGKTANQSRSPGPIPDDRSRCLSRYTGNMWNDIRGHQTQVELFRQAVASGRLSHSYLFAGQSGIGKKRFAEKLAAGLLCNVDPNPITACGECPSCKQVKVDTHPDLLRVGCPPDKTAIPISLLAGPPERRGREGLCYEISLKPAVADRRIAIIDDVEKLNVESGNTLLKTLEEPPAKAVFFLIVDRVEAVLPTIRSRCQLVQFSPLSDSDVAELVLENEIVASADEADAIARLSGGSMDAASQLADEKVRELSAIITDGIRGAKLKQPMTLAASVIKAIEGTSSDTAVQRINAHWALRFLGRALQVSLRRAATGQNPQLTVVESTGDEAVDAIGNMLQRVIDTESHLRQRMPMQLCFESMLDDLRRIASGQAAASA